MWKSFVNGLIASCVASDPAVYLYWLCARREAEEEAARPTHAPRSVDVATLRIELDGQRQEATA